MNGAELQRAAEREHPHGRSGPAVALAIASPALRGALEGLIADDRGTAHIVADPAGADIVITDNLALPPALTSVPAIFIGDHAGIACALDAGFSGGLVTDVSAVALNAALIAVANGLVCHAGLPTGLPRVETARETALDTISEQPPRELTARERDVLGLMVTGASNKGIARDLDITVHTVKFHVASIIGKLGASGRTDAVVRALRQQRTMM